MRLNLVNSKEDRNYVMGKENEGSINLLDILKKYGDVVDYMTEPMVAQFYGVPSRTITSIANSHGDELRNYGYRTYKRSELLNIELQCLENIPNRGLRLYPIKAVILIGMMLTESEVAEKLRKDIMDSIFGNEVTVPTTEGIRKVVEEELDKKVPQMIGCKDAQVKAIVKAVKGNLGIKNKKQNFADYETVMAWLLAKHNVYKLEDIPFSDEIYIDINNFIRKLSKQKRLF